MNAVRENEPLMQVPRFGHCLTCNKPCGMARYCSNLCEVRRDSRVQILTLWQRVLLVFKPR